MVDSSSDAKVVSHKIRNFGKRQSFLTKQVSSCLPNTSIHLFTQISDFFYQDSMTCPVITNGMSICDIHKIILKNQVHFSLHAVNKWKETENEICAPIKPMLRFLYLDFSDQ